jgi:hypothetical protein
MTDEDTQFNVHSLEKISQIASIFYLKIKSMLAKRLFTLSLSLSFTSKIDLLCETFCCRLVVGWFCFSAVVSWQFSFYTFET